MIKMQRHRRLSEENVEGVVVAEAAVDMGGEGSKHQQGMRNNKKDMATSRRRTAAEEEDEDEDDDSCESDMEGSSVEVGPVRDDTIKSMGFRGKAKAVLEAHRFHLAVLFLVLLDCLMVIGQILLDLERVDHNHPSQQALHWASLIILCVFTLEFWLKVYVYHMELFRDKRHRMELFDGAIVMISLALDIIFYKHHGAASALGLLVVLRFWRVARILNAAVMAVQTTAQSQLEIERKKYATLRLKYTEVHEELRNLKLVLEMSGIVLPSTNNQGNHNPQEAAPEQSSGVTSE